MAWPGRSTVLAAAGGVIFAVVSLSYVADRSRESAEGELRAASAQALRLYAENLRGKLARFEILPSLVAASALFDAGLPQRDDLAALHAANLFLEDMNALTGAADTYLLAPDGYTLAASNWRSQASFVGRNFAFRPYFQQAMQGGLGRYFALGTTSNRRGYYLAWPVERNGSILGAVVVKVGVAEMEADWAASGDMVFVTDPDGVVFLSGLPEWRFRTLRPLDVPAKERIAQSRRYPLIDLIPVGFYAERRLDSNAILISFEGESSEYLRLDMPMPELGWTIHIVRPTSAIESEVMADTAFAGAVLAVAALIAVVLIYRRRTVTDRLLREQREREILARSHDELEDRVRARTTELEDTNLRLRHEVAERRKTEEELRRAQADLVQAGKLAALGQLASGITHELSQPLTAIGTYADNASQFLERGRQDEVVQNLATISSLVGRAASIMDHLRVFARKTPAQLAPVGVCETVQRTVSLLTDVGRFKGVDLQVDLPGEEIYVVAESVRLEQVLINLLQNAVDAVQDSKRKRVTLTIEAQDGAVSITVSDSGNGISAADLPRLFEPFFSTKAVGQGMGLGLSISYGIVSAMGGSLRAANDPEGGASFVVELRRAQQPSEERANYG